MPSTYLDLTNQLLRRVKEPELTSTTFSTVAATTNQAAAKDFINYAIAEINQRAKEWPFNKADGTQVLVPGTEEYVWPSDFKNVEWKSFYIDTDDALGITYQRLMKISRDEYYRNHRYNDVSAGANGSGVPLYVYEGHLDGFGITPSPDKAYTLKFEYFSDFTPLSAYSDTSLIPTNWDRVIVELALVHMYKFRENTDFASVQTRIAQDALADMRNILLETEDCVSDTRVPQHYAHGGFNGG